MLQKQMSENNTRLPSISKPAGFSLGLSNINQKIRQTAQYQEPLSDRSSSKFKSQPIINLMSSGKKQHYLSINPKMSHLKVVKCNTNTDTALRISESEQYTSVASNNAIQKLSIKVDEISKLQGRDLNSTRKVIDLKTPPAV